MVVEPQSFCWLSGRLVERRDAATWLEELRRLPQLKDLLSDAGMGLCKALQTLSAERPELRHGLDVFHLKREGNKALKRDYGAASKASEQAGAKQAEANKLRRVGRNSSNQSRDAAHRWKRAEALLDQAAASERAWKQVCAALEWFTPEGRLNDRRQAEAKIREALRHLQARAWAKTRRLLERAETLTFLDRLQERVQALGFSQETLAALERLENLRRQPERSRGESLSAGAARGLALISTVQLARSDPQWQEKMARFGQVLQTTLRASSWVEGVNSVVRMQQARHRRMTQGLLDLKRLYWNMRPFHTGRRKKRSPYEILGLKLPPGTWWELLNQPLDALRQRLSAQKDGS
ncbi:MAG: hypothetical protein ACHP79_07550 [Terriglobales bacterium]